MGYLMRILGAISQLANAAFLLGDQNESISGRAYRAGWVMTAKFIDMLVFWENEHCHMAHREDVLRAHEWAKRYPL